MLLNTFLGDYEMWEMHDGDLEGYFGRDLRK